jgi:hypothetical protein
VTSASDRANFFSNKSSFSSTSSYTNDRLTQMD